MVNKKTIQELVNDKTCIVICHGERDESIVNDYNIVIRLGTDIKQADIWVNPFLTHHFRRFNIHSTDRFKYVLRLNAERGDTSMLAGYPSAHVPYTYFWNNKEFKEVANRVGYDRPTTGCLTVAWLAKNTSPKELAIIGMDFYKNGNPNNVHKPELEKEFITNLAETTSFINFIQNG